MWCETIPVGLTGISVMLQDWNGGILLSKVHFTETP